VCVCKRNIVCNCLCVRKREIGESEIERVSMFVKERKVIVCGHLCLGLRPLKCHFRVSLRRRQIANRSQCVK